MITKIKDSANRRLKEAKERSCKAYLERKAYNRLFTQEEANDATPPEYFDLYQLVTLIEKHKPEVVLEYGSGWSSYCIAETLRRNGKGKLYSVELSPDWQKITEQRLNDDLKPLVEFLSPSPEVMDYHSYAYTKNKGGLWYNHIKKNQKEFLIRTITFPELHNFKPDFVYLDGPDSMQVPGFIGPEGKKLKPVLSDPLFFNKPYVMAVDARRANCAFLYANFQRPFRKKIYHRQSFTIFHLQ